MRITGREVLKVAAEVSGFPVKELRGRDKRVQFVVVRQAAIAVMRSKCPHLSYTMIGGVMNRDHSTIMHGIREAADHAGTLYWIERIEKALEKRQEVFLG